MPGAYLHWFPNPRSRASPGAAITREARDSNEGANGGNRASPVLGFPPFYLLLPHPELLHLARHRERERVDEAHVARNLVTGDAPGAELPQLGLVERCALL